MRNLQQKLSIARGERPAERLFKNANLVNVLSGEIYRTHVAVDDGRVVGLGDYKAKRTIDLKGAYLAPSLIDGHFHVESSMLTTREFARAVVPHGTGVVVIDPHEYANVLGLDVRTHGDVVRKSRNWENHTELHRITGTYDRNKLAWMSGFAAGVRFRSSKTVPHKCLIINGWNGLAPKPDRITVGLEGWNLEPLENVKVRTGRKSLDVVFDPIRLAEWGANGSLNMPASLATLRYRHSHTACVEKRGLPAATRAGFSPMSGHRAHHQNACNRILGPKIWEGDAVKRRIGSWGQFERRIKTPHIESRRDSCEPGKAKAARGATLPCPVQKKGAGLTTRPAP